MRWEFVALGAGAGIGTLIILQRRVLAFEDETGETLTPEETRAEVARVEEKASAPTGRLPSLGEKAVEVLTRLVGTKEDPPKSNRGLIVDQINRGVHGDGEKLIGKAWCARTVRWAYEKAAEELKRPPPFAGIKGTLAAVTDWRDKFKGYETSPKPGAVGLLIKAGLPGVDKGKRHATLVVRVDGSKVVTVEGNHGDRIALVTRPKSDFAVFLDIDRYVAERGRSRVAGLLGLDLIGAGG